jgi:hypothetical protein
MIFCTFTKLDLLSLLLLLLVVVVLLLFLYLYQTGIYGLEYFQFNPIAMY